MSKTKELIRPRTGARPALRRITFYLTPDLVRRVKIRAIHEETDASTLVRAALEAYLGAEKAR